MTIRWLVCLALAASSASGQTVPAFSSGALATKSTCSHHLGVDISSPGASETFRLETRLLPKRPRLPDLSGLRSLWSPYTMVRAAQAVPAETAAEPAPAQGAARPAPARATSAACTAPCKPVLPFHQPPIDADGILARCNNLLSPVVSILHSLSANQHR